MSLAATLALSTEQQRQLLELIRTHLPLATVWAYGSRVKGTHRPSSDLDLVALNITPEDPALYALRDAFDESDLPFRVDLFAWQGLPDEFKPSIEHAHVVLHEGQAPPHG